MGRSQRPDPPARDDAQRRAQAGAAGDAEEVGVGERVSEDRLVRDAGGGVPGTDFPFADPDTTGQIMSFRVVAATYLGILTDDADAAVPALIAALRDDDPEVRAAAATALGSFGEAGTGALPALRTAAGAGDEVVSRAAGLALVKLQSSSRR